MTKRVKRIGILLSTDVAALALYLLFWPVGIDPAEWTPGPIPPRTGTLASNRRLADAQRYPIPQGSGPEDLAFDAKGRMYAGLENGRIVRWDSPAGPPVDFASTGGRPLGLDFGPSGDLYVADGLRGLLRVGPEGSVHVLATQAGGVPFGFTDDVAVAADGTVYFTDASSKYRLGQVIEEVLEHRPNGRLCAWDPVSGTARVILPELYFANGVTIAPDQSFLLVNETTAYRVRRYWLAGDKKGTSEILAADLPGFPDNVTTGDGRFWVALFAPREPGNEDLLSSTFRRKVAYRLPEFLRPAARRVALVLAIDGRGRIIAFAEDDSPGSYAPITSAREHGGRLWLGSLSEPSVASVPLSAVLSPP